MYRGLLGGASCLVPGDPGSPHSTGNRIKLHLTLRREECLSSSHGIAAFSRIRVSFILAPLIVKQPRDSPWYHSFVSSTHLQPHPHHSIYPSKALTYQTIHSPTILSTLIPLCLYKCASWCLWHFLLYLDNSFHRWQRAHLTKGSGSV